MAKDPQNYYGKTVSYKTGVKQIDDDTKWRIFYSDGSNIYLISAFYIDPSVLPEKNGKKPENLSDYNPMAAPFRNVISQYNGSSDITDDRIKKLNSDYFINNNYSSTADSMKSVAYMLDYPIWNSFSGGEEAEYAIGGPTLEMLFKSYCQMNPNKDYRAQAINNLGYNISADGGNTWVDHSSGMLRDRLYALPERYYELEPGRLCGADATWLATPSNTKENRVMFIHSGNVEYDYYGDIGYAGFRPIICLKPEVVLNQGTNGYDFDLSFQ